MDNIQVKALELEVSILFSELELSALRILQRVHRFKNFSENRSMEVDETNFLDMAENQLRKSTDDAAIKKLRKNLRTVDPSEFGKAVQEYEAELHGLKEMAETIKSQHDVYIQNLDKYVRRMERCIVPKCNGEPLEEYVKTLEEFMQLNWTESAANDRARKQRSLVEWMQNMDQSDEVNKKGFDALKAVLIEHGIRISTFVIDYLLMVMPILSGRKEILTTLYEFETILRCLALKENSIVIDTFISMVQCIHQSIRPRFRTTQIGKVESIFSSS
ncbi:hypothetical protein PanWU01x14_287210 [Parasponia andersonii]|uniref:Uncharacterized protein n=1 Tax=Parasponia andersonii TaxID=3476 RepID=A0A2P5AZ36_PARAD|nr:hypothetical protein PanWU01x14_287210 [Parasponia andersonii]